MLRLPLERKKSLADIARYCLPTNRENFSILKQVGEGAFGKVYLAKHRNTKSMVALKIMKVEDEYLENLSEEIAIQAVLKHDHILGIDGFFEEKRRVILVLDYAENGDLRAYIKRNVKLEEPESANFVRQICEGLAYCHSKDIIHRDLKPANILLAHNLQAKISDFGCSVQSIHPRNTLVGTPWYFSPEIIRNNCYYDHSIDVWAVGVMAYEMVEGITPFADHKNPVKTMDRILSCRYKVPGHFSLRLAALIRHILVSEPSRRFQLKDILGHIWLEFNCHPKTETTSVVPSVIAAFLANKFGLNSPSDILPFLEKEEMPLYSVLEMKRTLLKFGAAPVSLEDAFDFLRLLASTDWLV